MLVKIVHIIMEKNSLLECIIGMAQNFVGSNNIELLVPDGQFGTRLQGGKDAASARYIWTHMTELTQLIFCPDDLNILKYKYDDGERIEPEWYIPVIPIILVNGTEGIGTGFSTKVPSFNPKDIINNLKRLMNNKEIIDMAPWYRGFKGEVKFKDVNEFGNHIYMNKGQWKSIDSTSIEIIELPIGRWTDDYKSFLETLIYDRSADIKSKAKHCITSFENRSTESTVSFIIKFKKEDLKKLLKNEDIETRFRLTDTKNSSLSNMHLYNSECIITKYDSAESILKEFYNIRLDFYVKRKEYLIKKIKEDLDLCKAKVRFITDFIEGNIEIINKEDNEIEEQFEKKNYPKFGDVTPSYDYILSLQIRTLTKRKLMS